MITAASQSTGTLSVGARYVLAIVNGTAGPITPTIAGAYGTAGIVPENSATAFTVATGVTKWITFYAYGTSLALNDTSANLYWNLTRIE